MQAVHRFHILSLQDNSGPVWRPMPIYMMGETFPAFRIRTAHRSNSSGFLTILNINDSSTTYAKASLVTVCYVFSPPADFSQTSNKDGWGP